MVAAKKEVLGKRSDDRYEIDFLISKLNGLLKMGLESDFNSHTKHTWYNYLCVIDDLVIQLEEKV